MRKNIPFNNFSGGEWTPFLDSRADLQKYETACLRLENFRPLPWGGSTFRPGLEFFGLAKFGDRPCRMVPFNYSTSLSYVIEMGDGYMRFWYSNGTPVVVASAPTWVLGGNYLAGQYVEDPHNSNNIYLCIQSINTDVGYPHADAVHWLKQTAYEIVSPYTVGQVFQVQLKQINAQMRMVHPSVWPQTLTYAAATNWTIGATNFKYPVLLDQNGNQSLSLALGSTTEGASTTLTATAPDWAATTFYPSKTSVTNGGVIYDCLVSHTSGTFADDLFNKLWEVSTIFTAAHVGSYWELQHLRDSSSVIQDLNNGTVGTPAYTSPIEMTGDWTFTTSQFWWGEVQVQRSVDGGTTWTVIRDFTAKSDQNYSTSGTEIAPNIGYPPVLYRIAYTLAGAPFDPSIWVGPPPTQYATAQATLESQDAYVAGIALITAYTDQSHVTATVVLPPAATDPTPLWSEGAFSTYRGFPAAISFYEQRLLYCGTAYQPNNIWGSVTGDFDNFQYSSDDDGALSFQPAVCQQNQAAWIATLLRIHIGTSGEEIIMASGNLDEAITPSNVTCRAQSYYGSSAIQPLLLQNSILFVERNGLRVREMRELSPYIVPTDFVAPDLTLMAEHVTQPGIVAMDFAHLPDPLAYFVRVDGQLPVLTYNREQNLMAWARYVTAGSFESVACIYGAPADEVWVSVKRVINGATVRTIEGFTTDPAEYPSLTNNLLLDCGTQFLAGVTNPTTGTSFTAGATGLTGLTWLAGQTGVTAVIDGAEYAGLTVDNSGNLAFPANVTATAVVNVGLPYTGYLTPMKPVASDQEGSSQGRKVRVSEVVARVRNSVSLEFAGTPNPTSWNQLQFRSTLDTTGSMTALSNGILDAPLPGPWPDGNSFSGQVNIRQSHPYPLTIVGLFTKFDVL